MTKERPSGGHWVIALLAVVILFGAMFYLYGIYPEGRIGPQQPIYFSHRIHAGVKEISCRFCHPYVDRSQNAGIPAVSLCFVCHTYIIPRHPEIVKERSYLDTKTPVPWLRVFYIPDHVKFNHQPHIRVAIDCVACHGEVKQYDRLQRVDFKMAFCVDCHKQKNAPLDCWLACHH